MLEYSGFYDIAEYANENWKGSFTPKEIACNAHEYYEDFVWSKANNKVACTIQDLLENLEEDARNMTDNEDVKEWIKQIKAELNI